MAYRQRCNKSPLLDGRGRRVRELSLEKRQRPNALVYQSGPSRASGHVFGPMPILRQSVYQSCGWSKPRPYAFKTDPFRTPPPGLQEIRSRCSALTAGY